MLRHLVGIHLVINFNKTKHILANDQLMKPTETLNLESNTKLFVMNIHDTIRKQAQCIPT
jgi:hypothetical protein